MKTSKKIVNTKDSETWKNSYPSEQYHNLEKVGHVIAVDNHGYHHGTIEFRMGRSRNASTVHCVVRLWGKGEKSLMTSGKAGGYGYDKMSAAFADALHNAGIITKGVAGVGESAIQTTFKELLRVYTGKRRFNLITV